MISKWKSFLGSKKNLYSLVATSVTLLLLLFLLTRFLNFIELRIGVVFQDPLLSTFNPVQLSWLTFSIIYISVIAGIYSLLFYPDRLVFAMQCYGAMIIIRIIAMYLAPFNPPAAMIPLHDPFVEILGTGQMLTKDLYFSGHTATLFILFLTAINKKLKIVFLASTILVAVLVLLQHVHYTLDVISAPCFTFISFYIVRSISKQYKPEIIIK